MTARGEWPYLFCDKKALFNEAFQGVEAIGNIALKTGKVLSESTDRGKRKKEERIVTATTNSLPLFPDISRFFLWIVS